jgi:DNA topoisomerase-1
LKISNRKVPGISREKIEIKTEEKDKIKIEWKYINPDGEILKEEERIVFLNSLAVPPAWTEVWFDSDPKGHIQATGKDDKGRLQYRYHPEWIKKRADMKFDDVDEFGIALQEIRDRYWSDLEMKAKKGNMPFYKAVALVVYLMDRYHIRVGSDQYATENESYGLTTITNGHFKLLKGKEAIEGKMDAIFSFTGKSGKPWKLLIRDDKIVKMIQDSKNIGDNNDDTDLFSYTDELGNVADIKAEHINKYIQDATRKGYTAKNFRTWAASWKAAARLALIMEATEGEILQIPELYDKWNKLDNPHEFEPMIEWKGARLKKPEGLVKLAQNSKLPGETEKERVATMLAVVDTVAADLGNTRAVCRSSYIRPMFLEDWESGIFHKRWLEASKMVKSDDLQRQGFTNEETMAEATAIHYMKKNE